MREIEFRGKRVDNGEWVYGFFIKDTDGGMPYIVERAYWSTCEGLDFDQTLCYEIDPSTVGQITGLKDKNGKEIYEGDVFRIDKDTYLVTFDGLAFDWQRIYDSWLKKSVFKEKVKSWLSRTDAPLFYEIIGNVHDNPELLEVL